jgi:hypothetical protein
MCNKPVCDYTVKRMSRSKLDLIYIIERDNNVMKKLLTSTKGKTLSRSMSLLRKNTQVVSLMGSQMEEDFNYWKIRPPPKRKKESKEQDGQILEDTEILSKVKNKYKSKTLLFISYCT